MLHAHAQGQYVFTNGQTTTPIALPGNSCVYTWTNNTPGIGLAASGHTNSIPSFTAVNSGTTDVTATISLSLAAPLYNDPVVYVAAQLSGKVWMIDPRTNQPYAAVITGSEPYGVTYSPDRLMAYITNRTSGTVSVIRTVVIITPPPPPPSLNFSKVMDIPVGAKPEGITISPDGKLVYAVNADDATISVISAADYAITNTIPLNTLHPTGIAITPDGSKLYITNYGSGTVSVVTTADNKIKTIIPVGINPQGIAVSADGSKVYVANQGSGTVTTINTSNDALAGTSIPVGLQPFGLAVSPDSKMVYTANQGDNSVSAINTSNNQVTKINVGTAPHGISVSPDGTKVYVNNTGSDDVSIISTSDNSVSSFSQATGPFSFGNSVSQPAGCTIPPFTITITIKATPPAINYTGAPSAVNTGFGVASAATTFQVRGQSLTQGVLVTPPSGFEVSLDGDNFSPTLTIPANGNLAPTTVYIRLAKTTAQGTYSGYISLSSAGAPTVNVTMPASTVRAPEPSIITGKVSGQIYACAGQPSADPNLLQFSVSAVNLNGLLGATAPTGFEISLSKTGGFASHIDISNDTDVPETIIYVRTSTAIAAGTTNGNITFTSGPLSQKVAVTAVAFKTPAASTPTPATQTVINAKASTPIHFTGTGNTFIWKNDHPEINLPDNGTGDIASFTAVNNTSADITATITAWPVSYPLAYVANFSGNSVSVISINTGENIATISTNYGTETGSGPKALIVNADATRVYVANYVSNNITVIDASTYMPIAIIKVGEAPQGLLLSTDGTKLYVFNSGAGGSVSTINTATNMVTGFSVATTIPPTAPMSPDGKTAYVYSYETYNFSVYDIVQNKRLATLPGNTSPQGLVLSPDGKTIYLSDFATNKFYIIDATTYTIITTIPLHLVPQGVGISRDGKWVYITMANSTGDGNGQIAVINTETQEETSEINVGNFPSAIGTTGGTGCEGQPVTCTIIVKPTPPTITATGSPDALTTIQGNASDATSFNASGIKMQQGILITPPNGFEVSLDGTTYSTTVTIPVGANGVIASTKVYVRLSASAPAGTYSGDVLLSSLNAESVKMTLPPSEIYLPTSSILAGTASGSINTCEGAPSASPNIMQFTASGFLLTGDIKVSAPTGFEVSTNIASGYSASLTLAQSGGNVANTIIYVRSAASAKGFISGDVVITSSGATNRTAFVKANVGITPVVNPVANQTKQGGMATDPVNFTGTGNTYSWTNDNTSVGLVASGYGNIASFTAINKGGTAQVANITVTPLSAAFAYVAMQGSGRVAVINTSSNATVATIAVGQTPYAVAVSPDGAFVYVANQGSNNVSIINTNTNTEVRKVDVGQGPSGIIVSADGKKVYVANGSSNTVTVIDAATYATTTINVGVSPDGIAISPSGKTLYVVNRNSTFVSVINTDDLSSVKISTGGVSPEGVAVSPDGTRVYVTNYNGRNITVIDAATNTPILPAIAVGINPRGIAVSIDGSKVYVANAGSKTVSVIDTKTNAVTSVDVGTSPQGLSISPDGSMVYVANSGSNSMSVISTAANTVIATISNVGAVPVSFGNFITGGAGCTGAPVKFTITVNPESAYITTTGSLPPLTTTYGTNSSSGTFSAAGVSLNGPVTVTPPQGVEVSTDNITYTNTLTFGAAGNVAATTIYARLSSLAAAKTYTGNIVLSSQGAASINVPLTVVTKVLPAPLTVTANKVTKTVNTSLTGGPGSKAFTYTGIKNNETIGTVTITYGTGAEISAILGTYTASVKPGDATGGTFTASNYDITYVPADLMVTEVIDANLIVIPNAFSPNGDGINDTWKIKYLENFPGCTVSIFDRAGRQLFYSIGYGIPWDGTYSGKALPYGTYYYVIDINSGAKRMAGYVLLIK